MTTTEGRRFRVVEVLGKGGFGTVYRAEMLGASGFAKRVALKVLNPDVEGIDEVARRFRDEARMLGLLRHRAIVHVDGLLKLDGRWTVVMEFVEGVDLHVLLCNGPIPAGAALEVTQEVASALHVAYDRSHGGSEPLRLLHRDIKPANISLTPAGEVKVLDFGVARAEFQAREAHTRSLMFGSLPYMSPERMDFIDSHAGDVYALGVVLWEMMTAHQGVKTSSKPERHEAWREARLATLRETVDNEDVIALVQSCLAYDPEDRPTAREVARRARELRGDVGGTWLEEWAEEHVTAALAERETSTDALTGTTMMEQTGEAILESGKAPVPSGIADTVGPAPPGATFTLGETMASAPLSTPQEAPPPRRRRRKWVIGGVVGLLGLAGVLVLAWPGGGPGSGARLVPPKVQPAPPPVDDPAVAEQDPVPTTADPPADPQAPAQTETAPEPAKPAAEPKPEPARPTKGTVWVVGETQEVWLVGESGRHKPGSVPPGSYTVEATFDGWGTVTAGRVTVEAGQTVTLKCNQRFKNCKPLK